MTNNDIVPGFDYKTKRGWEKGIDIRLQKVDAVPGCLVLYLNGYIDPHNANYFMRKVAKAIESGFTRLIFHLAGFNMVSDVIVGSFVAFLKAVQPRGGDIVVVEIPPKVYECFALLGFAYFFNIIDNLNEAVAFLKHPGPFPRIFKCFYCDEKLKATKSEILRCPKCYFRFAVDDTGQIDFEGAMDNNEIVPGFDDEEIDKLKIRLQKIEEIPGCLILWIYGYVGKETHTYFQRQVQKAIETGLVRLIFPLIDYTKYQVPSKEFVSAFVDLSKTVRSKSGDIVLVEDPPTVYDLFLQLGYSQIAHNRKNLEEAVAFFSE